MWLERERVNLHSGVVKCRITHFTGRHAAANLSRRNFGNVGGVTFITCPELIVYFHHEVTPTSTIPGVSMTTRRLERTCEVIDRNLGGGGLCSSSDRMRVHLGGRTTVTQNQNQFSWSPDYTCVYLLASTSPPPPTFCRVGCCHGDARKHLFVCVIR